MYKVVLIDDEPLARQLIAKMLEKHEDIAIVAECGDGFEGFKKVQQHQPDLIFLDIQMPKINGFEMLEMLDEPPSVIFTTAFDEYALKAFEAHAVDYLLKPVTHDRFENAIERWRENIENKAAKEKIALLTEEKVYEGYQQRIVVKDNGKIRIIPSQDLHYIEASDDYIKINSSVGKFLKKSTLAHVEKTLDPNEFVRVHRSYVIPVNQLIRIEPYEKDSHVAILQCQAKIPVSKSGMSRLKQLLGW